MMIIKRIYASVLLISLVILCIANIKLFLNCWRTNADTIEASLAENFTFRDDIVNYHSYIERLLTPNALYKGGQMMLRRPDGRIVAPQDDCDLEEQLKGMENLSKLCNQKGIDLLYVNCPAQCGSDIELFELGAYSFCTNRSNRLLEGLIEKNIQSLNLDVELTESEKMFYYTDHHWTTWTGVQAAREIMAACNDRFDLNFDLAPLAESNLKCTVYERSWLGESGRYVGYGWAGRLDDYALIVPKNDPWLTYDIPRTDSHLEGGFDILLSMNRLEKQVNGENRPQDSISLHYTYLPDSDFVILRNMRKENGPKVLLIKDSFALSMAPFMILGANEIVMWDMRYVDKNIVDYINENDHDFDVVIVSYTEGSSIAKPQMYNFW